MEQPNPTQAGTPPDDIQNDADVLGQKLAEYENKIGEMREVLLRERAEIENQRKRLQRDLEQARKFANERLLGDLLPVFDGLERGLLADTSDAAALREDMDLTLKALSKVGEGNGLKAVDPVGQPFNPELHQAMTMVEAPGKAPRMARKPIGATGPSGTGPHRVASGRTWVCLDIWETSA